MKKYESPKMEIKSFVSEDVVTASGVSVNPLTAIKSKTFSVSEANASWKDKVN